MEILKVHDYLWEIPRSGMMRVPGRIYASEPMMSDLCNDPALGQVLNVACLPGIVGYSLAMPDIHWGYGFPIGGVATIDVDRGVLSPGGVLIDQTASLGKVLAQFGPRCCQPRREGPV